MVSTTSFTPGPDPKVRENLEDISKMLSEQVHPLLKAIAALNEAQLKSQKRLKYLTLAIVGLTVVVAVTAILRI